jgi:hypothetical protein
MVVFDGALVQSLVQRSARRARDARELAEALIDAAIRPASMEERSGGKRIERREVR